MMGGVFSKPICKPICHRGNRTGKQVNRENRPDYILECLADGLMVEIDVWGTEDGKLFLGHDEPLYPIPMHFLMNPTTVMALHDNFGASPPSDEFVPTMWVHCKNGSAADILMTHKHSINFFVHENDSYSITTFGYVWTQNIEVCKQFKINKCVLVDLDNEFIKNVTSAKDFEDNNIEYICTDDIRQLVMYNERIRMNKI